MENPLNNKDLLIKKEELDNFKINPSSLQNAFALLDAVSKELKDSMGVDIKVDKLDLKDGSDMFNIILSAVLSFIGSKPVREAVFKCLDKSQVISLQSPINAMYFEDEKHRKFFIPVMTECIICNLTPFLSGVVTQLSDLGITQAINIPVVK
jgi:hypothetical protein